MTSTTTMDATIATQCYALSNECPAPWPANASLTVVASYPFTSAASDETPHDFVLRAYYETLWMPEAILPLAKFVTTLRRVMAPPDASTSPLPLLVAPMLLSMKDLTTKYRVDIPQMITNGGTGEDAEEAMIQFAWTHEKRPENDIRNSSSDEEDKEAKWTKRWLQRFERRDTMLQILLHFIILSYPYDSTSRSGDKKRKRRNKKKAEPSPDHQANLDMLTDRLCIWRETEFALSDDHLGSYSTFSTASERDWLQKFCEDVVRPAFEAALPPLYELFKAKCFPELVPDDDNAERDELSQPQASSSRPVSRVPQSRQPSAEPRSNPSMARHKSASSGPSDALAAPLPPRTFSRSNSVVSNAGGANSQLLAANSRREVSMRRSMSVQRDPSVGPSTGPVASHKGKEKEGLKAIGASVRQVGKGSGAIVAGVTLAATRPARSSSFSNRQNTLPQLAQSQPVFARPQPAKSSTMLVPETPIPPRTFGRAATLNDLGGRSSWNAQSANVKPEIAFDDDPFDEGEDATMLFTDEPVSAEASRARAGSRSAILVQSTPARPRSYSFSSSANLGGRGVSQVGDNAPDELAFLPTSDRRRGSGVAHAGSALPLMIPETPSK